MMLERLRGDQVMKSLIYRVRSSDCLVCTSAHLKDVSKGACVSGGWRANRRLQ